MQQETEKETMSRHAIPDSQAHSLGDPIGRLIRDILISLSVQMLTSPPPPLSPSSGHSHLMAGHNRKFPQLKTLLIKCRAGRQYSLVLTWVFRQDSSMTRCNSLSICVNPEL